MNPHRSLSSALALLFACCGAAAENSAPSSHLVFDDRFPGDILINRVRVPADGVATYTYYETLGWRGKAAGYAGIQAHPKAPNFIFSIWDHEAHAAPIRAVHRGPGTLTEKFGGEGTGLKSWNFELGWEPEVWYTLVARAWAVGERTQCGFWAHSAAGGEWTHLVTMEVAAPEAFFEGGTDAFIEDWLSTGKERRAMHLRGGWKRKLGGGWHPFAEGRYSVNAWDLVEGKRSFNHRTHWDGGVGEDAGGKFYYMVSGGAETEPSTENPSTHAIAREGEAPEFPLGAITAASAAPAADGELVVTWETAADRAPPFRFEIAALDPDGAVLAKSGGIGAHLRAFRFDGGAAGAKSVRITGEDLFGRALPVRNVPVAR